MTVTYELPRYPILGTGIFASIYKSGGTKTINMTGYYFSVDLSVMLSVDVVD